jgi:hypothetical protein
MGHPEPWQLNFMAIGNEDCGHPQVAPGWLALMPPCCPARIVRRACSAPAIAAAMPGMLLRRAAAQDALC